NFQPLVRDIQGEFAILVVVVNFWQIRPDLITEIFDEPGDHAGELETSLVMHLAPDLVELEHAGQGDTRPFAIESLRQPGVWTPRPWSQVHPDTGCGNPAAATADKGRQYCEGITRAIADVLVGLAQAKKGQTPYL